jgi:hypothetical protein
MDQFVPKDNEGSDESHHKQVRRLVMEPLNTTDDDPLTKQEIHDILCKFDPTKAPGEDALNSEILLHTFRSFPATFTECGRRGKTDKGLPDRGGLRSTSRSQGAEEHAPDLWSDDQDPVNVPEGVQADGTQPKRLKTTREAGRATSRPADREVSQEPFCRGALAIPLLLLRPSFIGYPWPHL